MKIERGEVWLANLDPTQGSEQAGTRPIIIRLGCLGLDVITSLESTVLFTLGYTSQ